MHDVLRTTYRLSLLLGLLALAGCASRGTVPGGRPDPTIRPPARPGVIHGTLRAPGRAPRAGITEAVIYVDRAEPAPPPPPARKGRKSAAKAVAAVPRPARARIGIEPRGFRPRVVAVGRGDSLDVVNKDRRYHSAFSVSAPRRFDLGSIPPGGVRSLRFDRAGAVRMFCTLHSDSSGYVFVAPSSAFARADLTGAFALPELPPGSYRLKAWHPVYGERTWQVELTRRGMALELGF